MVVCYIRLLFDLLFFPITTKSTIALLLSIINLGFDIMVYMTLFCGDVRKNSVSSCEISPVFHLNYPHSSFPLSASLFCCFSICIYVTIAANG